MAKLNAGEQKILRNPPTESTWLCQSKVVWDAGPKVCGVPNSGKAETCWMCRAAKPRKPKLMWPQYLAACKKAGIEPGTRWRPEPTTDAPRPKPVRRKKGA